MNVKKIWLYMQFQLLNFYVIPLTSIYPFKYSG